MKLGAVSVAIVACATVVSAGKLGKTRLTEAFNDYVKTSNVEFNKINYEVVYKAIELENVNKKGDRLKVDFKLTCSDDLKGENKGKETHITEFIFKKPILDQVLIWEEAIRQNILLEGETHLWNIERIEEQEMLAEYERKAAWEKRRLVAQLPMTRAEYEASLTYKPGDVHKDKGGNVIVEGDDTQFWAKAKNHGEKQKLAKSLEDETIDEINKLKARLDHVRKTSWSAYNDLKASEIAAAQKKQAGKKKEDEAKDGDRKEEKENEVDGKVDETQAAVVIENITATVHCTPDIARPPIVSDGRVIQNPIPDPIPDPIPVTIPDTIPDTIQVSIPKVIPKPDSGVARPSTVFAVVAPIAAAVLMMA
jgi:hypothetical protein